MSRLVGDHVPDRSVELDLDEPKVNAPIVALHGMAERDRRDTSRRPPGHRLTRVAARSTRPALEPRSDHSYSISIGSRDRATTRATIRSPHPVHFARGQAKADLRTSLTPVLREAQRYQPVGSAAGAKDQDAPMVPRRTPPAQRGRETQDLATNPG